VERRALGAWRLSLAFPKVHCNAGTSHGLINGLKNAKRPSQRLKEKFQK